MDSIIEKIDHARRWLEEAQADLAREQAATDSKRLDRQCGAVSEFLDIAQQSMSTAVAHGRGMRPADPAVVNIRNMGPG